MAITLDGSNGILSPDFEPSSSTTPTNGLFLPAANALGFATNSTERLRLDASGNLGVGTTSPTYKLTVAGYSNVASSNKFAIGGTADYQALLYMENATETFTIENTSDYAASAIILKTNNAERARIDSSGNLLVGTTSASGKLTVNNTANDGVRTITSGAYWSHSTQQNNAGTQYFSEFSYGATRIGSIQGNNTSTSYNTSSDRRLKENIVDAPSALSSVNAIKVRSFDWKSDGSHVDYGYIAQELIEIVPEAVSIPADPEEMMGVDFGKLTPRIIKALQELTARLEALENK